MKLLFAKGLIFASTVINITIFLFLTQALQEERLLNEPPSPSDYEKPHTYLKDQRIGFDNENSLNKPSDYEKPQESFKKRPNAFEYVKLLRNESDGLQTTNLKVCTSHLYFPVCISLFVFPIRIQLQYFHLYFPVCISHSNTITIFPFVISCLYFPFKCIFQSCVIYNKNSTQCFGLMAFFWS